MCCLQTINYLQKRLFDHIMSYFSIVSPWRYKKIVFHLKNIICVATLKLELHVRGFLVFNKIHLFFE